MTASTLPPPARSTVYAALVALLALAGLDQTLLSTALPLIAADLHGRSLVPWVFSAYLIASTVVIPLYGKLADRVGPRPLLVTAGGLFVAGSLACALSPSIEALVAARALQGLGGGGLMTLTMLTVAALFTPQERAHRQGLLGAAYGIATMLGPLAGGVLVQHLSWRWALAVNVPAALVALGVLARARFGHPAAQRHRLDLLGAGLLGASLVGLLLATRDGVVGTPAGAGLAALGATGLLSFVLVERRATDPLVPLTLFGNRAFAAAAGLGLLSGVTMFAAIVFLPLYLQMALQFTPVASAVHLLPLMLCLTAAANGCGRALRAGLDVRKLGVAAMTLMAVSFSALVWTLSHAAGTGWAVSLAVVPLGLGLGLLFPLMTVVSQRHAPPRHLGVATAMPIMLRALGGAVGVSALGSVLSHGMGEALGAAASAARGSAALAEAVARHPELADAFEARVAAAMAGSLQTVFVAAAVVSLAGVAVALALPRRVPLAAPPAQAAPQVTA